MAIPQTIKDLANKVRTAVYGKEVRESLAKSMEETGNLADETKTRQDSLESQFQNVLDETTGKDVISAPEITAARGSHPNLKDRLDTEHTEVMSSLAQSAEDLATNVIARKANTTSKKILTIIDDDGRIETFTKLKPVADEKGVKFSFCVITGRVGNPGYMTWEQIQQLANEGHEVQSHTVNHLELAKIPLTEAEFELKESKKVLRNKGFDPKHIVYPGGSHNLDVMNVTRKYYNSGIAIMGNENYIPIEQYEVSRHGFDTGTEAFLNSKVDKINTNGSGWLVLMLHTWDTMYVDGTKDLQLKNLIDYAISKGFEIKTYDEGFQHFGNLVDIGSKAEGKYLKVDPEGNIHNQEYDNIGTKRYPTNSILFDTPPSFFGKDEISITDMNSGHTGTPFPDNNQGTLITYSGGVMSYQYWHPYQRNAVYARRKNSASDTWDAFNATYAFTPHWQQAIDFGTVNAHSTKDIQVDVPNVVYGKDIAIVNPHWGLTAGLMWSATIPANGKVTVRLANVTASAITVPSTQQFKIMVAKISQ